MSYVNKWKRFIFETKKKAHRKQKRKQQLHEISQYQADEVMEWFGGQKTWLSFNDLFKGALRIAFPLATEDESKLYDMVAALLSAGYTPHNQRERGSAESLAMTGRFLTKKVKQKVRLAGGEEAEEEREIADLKVYRESEKVIPAGPRKGEKITQRETLNIAKALKKVKAPTELQSWWLAKQAEYTKDKNWEQIEAAYSSARGGSTGERYVVIVSRHPLDVLRMSDIGNIRSCHSEGGSYFKCAVAESRGHGPIAYLVKQADYEKVLQSSTFGVASAAGLYWKPDDEPSEPVNLSHFDDIEIFSDGQRRIKGISAQSRLRLRQYYDRGTGIEFAVPEMRTYGPHPPGFRDVVSAWAWNEQKDHFIGEDGEELLPEQDDINILGGSYRDSSDADLLNYFFSESGEDVDQYRGDVEQDTEDEDAGRLQQWTDEIEEHNNRAGNILSHASFYADIEDYDVEIYISASAQLQIEVLLDGWDGATDHVGDVHPQRENAEGELVPHPDLKSIPDPSQWSPRRDFTDVISQGEEEDLEYEIELEPPRLIITYSFRCEDCNHPDDVAYYLDYVKADYDDKYKEIVESVRQSLVNGGFIKPNEWDTAAESLEEKEFENFQFISDEEGDGEIWVYSKSPSKGNLWPLDIKIPKEFRRQGYHDAPFNGKSLYAALGNSTDSEESNYRQGYLTLNINTEENIAAQLVKLERAAHESAAKQLQLDLGDGWEPKLFGADDLAKTLTMGVGLVGDQGDLGAYIRAVLSSGDTKEEIQVALKFIELLDNNIDTIKKAYENVLQRIIADTLKAKRRSIEEFESGKTIVHNIEHLKSSSVPDHQRLGLWIEQNWRAFNRFEKQTAVEHYLIPTFRGEGYVHYREYDQPKHWNGHLMAKAGDITYKWTGPSINDVMPFEDSEAEPEDDSATLVTEGRRRKKIVVRIKTS